MERPQPADPRPERSSHGLSQRGGNQAPTEQGHEGQGKGGGSGGQAVEDPQHARRFRLHGPFGSSGTGQHGLGVAPPILEQMGALLDVPRQPGDHSQGQPARHQEDGRNQHPDASAGVTRVPLPRLRLGLPHPLGGEPVPFPGPPPQKHPGGGAKHPASTGTAGFCGPD